MSEFSDAFDEMLDAQEDACGRRVKCKVNGREVDFLAGDAGLSQGFIGGGEADAGLIVGHVRRSDFPNGIEKFMEFTYDGRAVQVLDTKPINATIEITAGEPAADEG